MKTCQNLGDPGKRIHDPDNLLADIDPCQQVISQVYHINREHCLQEGIKQGQIYFDSFVVEIYLFSQLALFDLVIMTQSLSQKKQVKMTCLSTTIDW
jgi:hypothetical protein